MADTVSDERKHFDWGYIAFVTMALLTVGVFFVWNNADAWLPKVKAKFMPAQNGRDTAALETEPVSDSLKPDLKAVREAPRPDTGIRARASIPPTAAAALPAHAAAGTVPAAHAQGPTVTVPKTPSGKGMDQARDGPYICDVPAVQCRLAGTDGTNIVAAVRLQCSTAAVREEAAFKKDIIRQSIIKTLTHTRLDNANIEHLRTVLKTDISRLMKDGGIVDLEFTDFRPAEQEQK